MRDGGFTWPPAHWIISTTHTTYRVVHNKPDYLLLLSKFCISTTKHVSMTMYVRCSMCPPPVATTSDNRLRNCPIARWITSWPICSQQVCTCRTSFSVQRLECDDDAQAVGVLSRLNSPLGWSLGYSAANFLVPQILAHEDVKYQLLFVHLLRQRQCPIEY